MSRVGDRAETLISPELQASRIESYAAVRGLEVEMLAPELDVSGGKAERPILSAAIRLVQAGEAAGIIVAQLDRLSRMDITDALRTIRSVEDAGGEVIAVAENFDAATPEGRLARNMFLSIGQLQLDRYKAQFSEAKRQAVKRGIWPTNTAPIGYSVGPERSLEPNADAPRVVRAFTARAAGEPWRIVGRLIDRGASGAQRVIRNRVYLGELRLRVDGDSVVRADAHPAIVSRALWESAQRTHPRPARKGNERMLLAGLVRCAGCRGLMSAHRQKGWIGYRCVAGAHRASGPCQAPAMISVRLLDPYVEAIALAAIRDLRWRARQRVGDTADLERVLTEAEDEFAAFQDAVSASGLGAEVVARGLNDRAARVQTAQRDLARAHSLGPAVPDVELGALWPEMTVEEKGHVLRGALGVVWVRRGRGIEGRVRVIEAGAEPDDLPRSGRRHPVLPLVWDDDLAGELGPPPGAD